MLYSNAELNVIFAQIESGKKEIEDLKRKIKELCVRSEKDHESSMKERVDLVRRLADFRRIHKRDQRRIEDVLSEVYGFFFYQFRHYSDLISWQEQFCFLIQ